MDIPEEVAYLLWHIQRATRRHAKIGSPSGNALTDIGKPGVNMIHYLRALTAKLRGLFGDHRADEELDSEIEVHIRMLTERYVRQGMTEAEAARAARRQFGNVTLLKEAHHDMRGIRFIESIFQDLKYGLWTMKRNPGFTLVAILTLALGIGANTAIFSVVNALVFNPLPYPDPQRLVWVTNVFRGDELIGTDMYFTYQEESKTLDQLAAYVAWTMEFEEGDEPERVNYAQVTASAFPAIGVAPWLGRTFTSEEDQPGGPPVAVISHDYWRRHFGGDPSIVGQSVTFGAVSRQVIGVMPPGFRFLPEQRVGGKVDIWIPFALDKRQMLAGAEVGILEGGVFGRLKLGVSVEQSRAELDLILRRFAQNRPFMPPGLEVRVTPLAERLVGHLRLGLLALFGSVGFVLLIACANVANLLLARANARQKELAIRSALGAGRGRLIRQMLTESLSLSVLGGAAGLLLAWWGVKALVAFTPENLLVLKLSGIDKSALVFTFLATLLTGVAAGIIPALQASRVDLNESLKDGARAAIFLKRRSARRISPTLVISELALTLVVLIGAGLLVKSFVRMRAVDPGYNPENLLTMGVGIDWGKYPGNSAQRKNFNRELVARLSALPGVQAVAYTRTLPLSDNGIIGKGRVTVVGSEPVPDEQKPLAEEHTVSPDYFRAMQMKLRAGHSFTELDTENTLPVIVINETLARRLFFGEDPVGKRILSDGGKTELTVAGVVADVKQYGLETESQSALYRSSLQNTHSPGIDWVIRAAGDPMNLLPAVRREIGAIEPDYKLFHVTTMERLIADSYAPRRFQTWLFGLFAAVALAIATVGIYGVISYAVSQRTHEIGVRMALGAQAGDVLWMVIKRGIRLALASVAIGLTAAFALTGIMKSLLFEVSPSDPATFAVITLLLIGVALIASYIPARRATKVDPMVALRAE
jgi:putative ABC transport system permease protein